MPKPVMRTCKKCGRNRAEKFFVGTRGRTCATCRRRRTSVKSRSVRLEETYGITTNDYDEILHSQGDCCAICLKSYTYNLDVDHDHKMEKVLLANGHDPLVAIRASLRGGLCKRCNRRMLPAAGDDPETLRRAARYLEEANLHVAQVLALVADGYEQTSPNVWRQT